MKGGSVKKTKGVWASEGFMQYSKMEAAILNRFEGQKQIDPTLPPIKSKNLTDQFWDSPLFTRYLQSFRSESDRIWVSKMLNEVLKERGKQNRLHENYTDQIRRALRRTKSLPRRRRFAKGRIR